MALGPAKGMTKDDEQLVLLVLGLGGALLASQRGGQQEGQQGGGSGTTVDAGAFPGDVLELVALKLREGGEGVLVHGLGREEHPVPLLWQPLHGRGRPSPHPQSRLLCRKCAPVCPSSSQSTRRGWPCPWSD